ncbi:MAG: hypothetical protein J6Z11_00670, partial [Candidatus Riflebacteria bacterium]|nr:hypothetical protein [Candidatus Riflebacteria bacterium]
TEPVAAPTNPTPIKVTEPVAAPTNPTPIKVTEPVAAPTNPTPQTFIEPVKVNENNNNNVVPSISTTDSIEEKITPTNVIQEESINKAPSDNLPVQNESIQSEKVPLPSIIKIDSNKETDSFIKEVKISIEETKPVSEEIISSPENDKSSVSIEVPKPEIESSQNSVEVNIGE